MAGRHPCCAPDTYHFPAPPQNIVVFDVTGYMYRAIPVWFNSTGERQMPLDFSVAFNKLLYRWTFYKPENQKCDVWYLSTSDDIVPVIHEFITGRKMKVTRHSKHNGYTNWEVRCS